MTRGFVLLLCAYGAVGYGYDSGGADQAACGRPYRSGRVYQPPCDVNRLGYCGSAGTSYPWHAVKRFVRDNQGLMRRMYGDQRHGHVLRDELEEDLDPWDPLHEWQPPNRKFPRYSRYEPQNEDDLENEVFEEYEDNLEEARFLRDEVKNDDVLKTKFVYSEEPAIAIKLAGLKTAPHFRPTTQKITTDTTTILEEVNKTTTMSANSSLSDTSSTTPPIEEDTTTPIKNEDQDDSTTDTTTDQTTILASANDRVGEGISQTNPESESEFDQPGTVLFQDMEDPTKKKMHVNYKMKGINACPVKEEVVAPFWANNTRGEVLALLNMYPFEQYVHWEKCTYENRQMYCREGCRCEQQYRLHRLLAYDPNNECRGIFSDWFRFPSCCVCKCYNMPPEFRVTSRSPRFYSKFPDD